MELGRIGLNVNGDVDEELIASRSALADRLGIPVWIGELDCLNPFKTAEIVAENTSSPVAVFCSPSRRSCDEIRRYAVNLRKKYDNDFVLTLVPGKTRKISKFVECMRKLKDRLDIPVLAGCSGKRLIAITSEVADGLVVNYCNCLDRPDCPDSKPDSDSKLSRVFTACYAASLIFEQRSSELYGELILSSAVMLNRRLRLNSDVDFEYIVRNRDCLKIPEKVKSISKTLEAHTISGSVEEVIRRIVEALRTCNHVIIGSPFFRDEKSVKHLKTIVDTVECQASTQLIELGERQ